MEYPHYRPNQGFSHVFFKLYPEASVKDLMQLLDVGYCAESRPRLQLNELKSLGEKALEKLTSTPEKCGDLPTMASIAFGLGRFELKLLAISEEVCTPQASELFNREPIEMLEACLDEDFEYLT